MERLCLLIRTAPYGCLAVAEGVRHLIGAAAAEIEVTAVEAAVGVMPLEDSFLAAVRPSTSPAAAAVDALLSSAIPVYVAEPDLRLRGFSAAGLPTGVRLVDDRRIVDLLMANDTRALGCF